MNRDHSDWKRQITEFRRHELLTLIQLMSREQIIEWLEWNDHNGVYNDKDSMDEFGRIMAKSEGESIMFCQISGISYVGEGIDYIEMYDESVMA